MEARSHLFGFSGVQAVARGYARVDGTWTRIPAWLVFVERKRPWSRLHPHERLPRLLDGERVDVLEDPGPVASAATDAPEAQGTFTGCVRPLQAGFSFGLKRRTGTLGLVVAPAVGPSRPLLLSSSHVLNDRADGERYALFQPGGRDRMPGSAPVATAWRYTRLHPGLPNTTEGALATVREDVRVEIDHPLGPLHGVAADVEIGTPLLKVSRSTGAGVGRLVAKDWCGRVRIGRRRYPFQGQWLVHGEGERVSLSGDSGSMWLTADGRVAAMNFAGGGGGSASVSTPAERLFRRLGIRIPTRAEGNRWRVATRPT